MGFTCPRCDGNVLRIGVGGFSCRQCHRSYPLIDGITSFVDNDSKIGQDSYDASAFDFLWQMEQKHFWHVGRREIILDLVRRTTPQSGQSTMLEIGCGNGSVLAYLRENGFAIEGGDLFLEGLRFCQQRADVPLYQVDLLALPFREEYDNIGLFDVLEHIDRDEEALVQVWKALRPGGYLVCTVPASKRLWSRKDISAHHQRRYEKGEMVAKLGRNGFSVRRASYFVFFFFPIMLGIRSVSRLRSDKAQADVRASVEFKTIPVLNGALLWLFRIERFLLRHWSLPFGASLLVVAQKGTNES